MNSSTVGLPAASRSVRQSLLAMLGLCFVLMMVALDQTVIGTALPTAVAELKGFGLYAWVGTAYLLTSVITVPVMAKLGDDHGRKPIVLAAIVVFTLASMLCGAAQSMLQLVLARGLQGVGGGMLVATTFACIPDLFPDQRQRLRWQVLFSASFGVANAVGPSLGGYLAQYWGWRWVFLVNLPVGLLSLYFVWHHLPLIRHHDNPPSKLDWQGAALSALVLGSLQLFVEWLPQHKPVWVLALLAVLGLGAAVTLVWWERRCPNPVLPVGLLVDRHLAPMLGLSLLMGFGLFGVVYYVPLMLQGGFGLAPNAAGLLVTPLAVCITVGSILNGRIVHRLRRPTRMLHVGVALFVVAALGLAQIGPSTPHGWLVACMVSGGVGLGLVLPNLTLFVQTVAQRSQLGVATALLQSTRMVGGMVGTAIIGTWVSHRYAQGVEAAMADGPAQAWRGWLADPQILIDPAMAARFKQAVLAAGQDSAAYLQQAREALIASVHHSQWLLGLILLVGLWLCHKVPALSLQSKQAPHG